MQHIPVDLISMKRSFLI